MSGASPRFAVILAGGEGTRFWPASTAERPKQLLPLASEEPLIRDTVLRAERLVGNEAIRVVAGSALVGPLREATPELGAHHFLVEPRARSTGPALAWAAWEIERQSPGAVLISLHADHAIHPVSELVSTVELAVRAAEGGALVCIGVEPDRPETGYGYVETGEVVGERTWKAKRFVEKPDEETAREYVSGGGFLWNSGIFVWRAADFLASVRELAPEIADALPVLETEGPDAFFQAVTPIAVDVAVMERSPDVQVVAASFSWDDVGSWSAVARTRAATPDGNVLVGKAAAFESEDNVVWVEDGDVTLYGVRGLVVVRSGGRILVTSQAAAPDLKRLVERLREGER